MRLLDGLSSFESAGDVRSRQNFGEFELRSMCCLVSLYVESCVLSISKIRDPNGALHPYRVCFL